MHTLSLPPPPLPLPPPFPHAQDTLRLEAPGEDIISRELNTSRVQPSMWFLKHSHLSDVDLFNKFKQVLLPLSRS